jgi:hypothetical protein
MCENVQSQCVSDPISRVTGYIDKEYATNFKDEVEWLLAHGIRYTYTKIENGVRWYKYKKNVCLYATLTDFYRSRGRFD